jgi:papain like protease
MKLPSVSVLFAKIKKLWAEEPVLVSTVIPALVTIGVLSADEASLATNVLAGIVAVLAQFGIATKVRSKVTADGVRSKLHAGRHEADRNYRRHIPETVVAGKPLGRHVNHDPRSLAYLVRAVGTAVTVLWARLTAILDQGNVGSCTGNAATGVLGSNPFYPTLSARIIAGILHLDEAEALALYSAATKLDPYSGTYPPSDTGSDGLSVAKAAKAAGLISGYLHMTSVAACQTAIKSGPFIIGSNWYDSFDNPDASGVVEISAGAQVRGGHEYECLGYDAETGMWELVNSWGDSWGVGGHFFYSDATLARLLSEDGDATSFVPLSQPAPVPTPVPGDPLAVAVLKFHDATVNWAGDRHIGSNKAAAAAARDLYKAAGLKL